MLIPLKALIFDYGNVLCEPQKPSDVTAMAALLGIAAPQLTPLYWRHRMDYDAAVLDGRAYWKAVAADAGRDLTETEADRLIQIDNESWSRPSPVVVAWANRLRGAGMRTGVLSNMAMDLRIHLATLVPWFPTFDHLTFSCDLGSCKPEPRIYQDCLAGLGVSASEALFLDDRPENVEAAQKLGIHSFVFTDYTQAARELDERFAVPAPLLQ